MFFSMFSFDVSVPCLFYIFAFRCFVVLCFVIDPCGRQCSLKAHGLVSGGGGEGQSLLKKILILCFNSFLLRFYQLWETTRKGE